MRFFGFNVSLLVSLIKEILRTYPGMVIYQQGLPFNINVFVNFSSEIAEKGDKRIIRTPFVKLLILRINILIATNRIKQSQKTTGVKIGRQTWAVFDLSAMNQNVYD